MPRKTKYQEFFRTLREVTGLTTAQLAKACGKRATNVGQYISGDKSPGKSATATAMRNLADWRVQPFQEVAKVPDSWNAVPEESGIYALYDSGGNLLYVGQALRLRTEIKQTLGRKTNFPVRQGPSLSKKAHPKYRDLAAFYSAYVVPSKRLRHNLEALLLRMFPNQSHNNKLGTFQ